MPRNSISDCSFAGGCVVIAAIVLLLSAPTLAARQAAHAPAASPETRQPKLAFTLNEKGEYEFDTGVLRGKILRAEKSLGLSSLIHIPSATRLDGRYCIMSYYRLFTTNKRYGTAAWDWPSKARLLPDGSLRIIWPQAKDRPFEIVALYRWTGGSTLDLRTTVRAHKDLSSLELFLASYFDRSFSAPCVYVHENPHARNKTGFMSAEKSFGDWQMFPRDKEILPLIRDGRWLKQPNPVNWKIMPRMERPIALRRNEKTQLNAVLMAPPRDCFAISTPYRGEGHCSLYLSLFGRDLKAGRSAQAHTRLVITADASDAHILDLYHKYLKDLNYPDIK